MKNKIKIIAMISLSIFLVCFFILAIYICWEPSKPPKEIKSEYDMEYIGTENPVTLSATNMVDLQTKVLEYVSSLKQTDVLKGIYVRLNMHLDVEECTFEYILTDVEGYYGVLSVSCQNDGDKWTIYSAYSIYFEGKESYRKRYSVNEDIRLQDKVEAIVLYIQQEALKGLGQYEVDIFNKKIVIRGYKLDKDGIKWSEQLIENEDGSLTPMTEK